MAMSLFNLFN